MSDRPVDVSLVCALFVVLAGTAFAGLFPALSAFGAVREAPHVADRVAWSLGAVAVFLLLFTLLGLIAAITLWSGEPVGLTLGLLFIAAWILQTVVLGLWTEFGPAAAGRVGDGFGAWEAVRVGVGGVLFVHLRRVGGRYVEAEAATDADETADEATGST